MDAILAYVDGDPVEPKWPETEVIIPRLKNDLVDLLTAVAGKKLNEKTFRWFIIGMTLLAAVFMLR